MSRWRWPRYVPVAERRAKAVKKIEKMRKQGLDICPVHIQGRTIARSFWGKGWCDHLESFSDFANRLPRGRTYVRNGSVCHLEIGPGQIKAMVSGSRLYNVSISIAPLRATLWEGIKKQCSGEIGSFLELLQGKLSGRVMDIVADRQRGLFPGPRDIRLNCDCPDWATMCKHVAAVLYGIGNRLDDEPELLFQLRGVDAQELISTQLSIPGERPLTRDNDLSDEDLGELFGIDFDPELKEPGSPQDTSQVQKAKTASPVETTPPSPRQQPGTPGTRQAKGRASTSRTGTKSLPEEHLPRASGSGQTRPRDRLTPPTGKKIARLRKQTGLSVADFAHRLGVSAASVSRWESSRGKLRLHSRSLTALMDLQQELHSPGKESAG